MSSPKESEIRKTEEASSALLIGAVLMAHLGVWLQVFAPGSQGSTQSHICRWAGSPSVPSSYSKAIVPAARNIW